MNTKPDDKKTEPNADEKRRAEQAAPISRDTTFDPETVISQNIYKVGFMPPLKDSLTLGELYLELSEGAAPRVWIGIQNTADVTSNVDNIDEHVEGGPAAVDPHRKVNRGPVVLFGSAGEPRDPNAPATPAEALPTPQQQLPSQYQDQTEHRPEHRPAAARDQRAQQQAQQARDHDPPRRK